MGAEDGTPLLCHRCGADLAPGAGNFYIVRIIAVADPTPPTITEADLETDIESEIQRLLDELRGLSEQEAADQVFRRLTVHLCARCFNEWIEDPTG